MSWFKLNVNDSLNTLKGQISNVVHDVQDAFIEGVLEENVDNRDAGSDSVNARDDSILAGLEAANYKIDELNALCGSKDDEVIVPFMTIF